MLFLLCGNNIFFFFWHSYLRFMLGMLSFQGDKIIWSIFFNTNFKKGFLTWVKSDGVGSPPTNHPLKKKNHCYIYSLGFYFGIGWQLSLVLDHSEEVMWAESLLMLKVLWVRTAFRAVFLFLPRSLTNMTTGKGRLI